MFETFIVTPIYKKVICNFKKSTVSRWLSHSVSCWQLMLYVYIYKKKKDINYLKIRYANIYTGDYFYLDLLATCMISPVDIQRLEHW